MAAFKDYFSSASDDYKRFRPVYPAELFQYLADISPDTQAAWDCGCGNGQATALLAQHFRQVTGTDASAEQIRQTHPLPNVTYKVAPAELIDAPATSLDLITVAQAIHWFDHVRFFAEVERTLKPDGVLAVWGYQLLHTDTVLDDLIVQFHSKIVGPYWPAERALLDGGYSRIDFPYPRLDTPTFYMRQEWKFGHLLGYLNTWSAVKQYEKALGHNPVEQMAEQLLSAWGDPEISKAVYWPLILYTGRK